MVASCRVWSVTVVILAMDPMVRSRRGAAAQGEPETEATGAQLERDYQTALGQADPGMNPREVVTSVVPGEASPGTLEQGGAGGGVESLPLPTASPFHSERVRDQVELLRKRPADLDFEQARIEAERLGPSGALEPDYSTAFGTNPDVGPRVARVEAVGPSAGTASEAAVTGSGSGPVPGVRLVSVDKAGPESGLQSGSVEGVFTSPEDDTPELLPDNDRTARLEQVVSQLIEENRSLRRRVEQAEWRSHSSYHSGTPGEAAMMSPVSFAVNEGHAAFQPFSPSQDLSRYVAGPPRGLSSGFAGFQGPTRLEGLGAMAGEVDQSLQHSQIGARPPDQARVPNQSLLSIEDRSKGYGVSEVASVPSPPVPLAPPSVPGGKAGGCGVGLDGDRTQTMREFTSCAAQSGIGTQGGSGYYTPRSGGYWH